MNQDYIKNLKDQCNKAIEFLLKDLQGLRTGKANAALVEDIAVDAYGNEMPIKGVASIAVPDAKSIIITPWDKILVSAIEKSIRTSELNLSPVNMGDNIRINIPPITEERRKNLVKVVKEKGEESRVALRNVRHDMLDMVKKEKNSGSISEDDAHRLNDQINKNISNYNNKIDEIVSAKQQEMMQI